MYYMYNFTGPPGQRGKRGDSGDKGPTVYSLCNK